MAVRFDNDFWLTRWQEGSPMRREWVMVTCLVFVMTAAAAPDPRPSVVAHAMGHPVANTFGTADEMRFKLVVRNQSQADVVVSLADHHDHHGTLPYPTSVRARVRNSSGKLLTGGPGESCSQYDMWSTLFPEHPGDLVTLRPGQEVTRYVPLAVVLRGCPTLGEGLKPGQYDVQFLLDGALSNTVRFVVQPENE